MAGISQIFARVRLAIRRTRLGVLLMGCAYAIGLIVGMVSVHMGHQPTLAFRDRIVSKAQASSPILHYSSEGRPIVAAGLDCVGNLMGATATASAGWWAPAPFPVAIYRGWIGGIVSVDSKHRSRFRATEGGLYYALVVTLQLIAFILAGGAGVNLGLAPVPGQGPNIEALVYWAFPLRPCEMPPTCTYSLFQSLRSLPRWSFCGMSKTRRNAFP